MRIANFGFKRHKVKAVFGEQRCGPRGGSDRRGDGNHAPAVRHSIGHILDLGSHDVGHGHEVKRRWPSPKPNLTRERQFHASMLFTGSTERASLRVNEMANLLSLAECGSNAVAQPLMSGVVAEAAVPGRNDDVVGEIQRHLK